MLSELRSRMMDPVMSNERCDAGNSGPKDSHGNLDGIISIMLRQETLFKEQVQELHRLYKVQKLEMQELRRKKNHLNLETAELTDGFSSISELEERSGELVRPVARAYKPESGSLSLHPFCSLKLFESSGSVSFGGSFQRLEPSQNKLARDFDLERFPENWVDMQIQANDCSPTSKESEFACIEDYRSEKSNNTSEDGLSTNWAAADQDSSPADPIDKKVKLSHQGSFASVNGCLNSSGSEGEENNSKTALHLR